MTLTAALLAGIAAVPTQAVADPSAPVKPMQPATPAKPTSPPSQDKATLDAWAQARKTGKRVEVPSRHTETSTVWAEPDGKTLTADIGTTPVRVRTGKNRDSWTPIDTTLAEKDGVLVPKQAKIPLEISPGRSRDLVTAKNESGSAGFGWTKDLPKPTLHKSTAIYTDAVAPGVDLVVQALPDGFLQKVVFRRKPGTVPTVRLPLTLPKGVTTGRAKDGTPQLMAGGKPAGAPLRIDMLDAKAAQGSGRVGTTTTIIEDGTAGRTLVIQPDEKFFADPSVTYPVTMTASEPVTGDATRVADTFVCSDQFKDGQIHSEWLRTGSNSIADCRTSRSRCDTTSCPRRS
ncbi:hypothetical protein [Bailinhaonella thermotolerans]|uniref:Uncharacterized protein n=1 Tax=Bailinhaonella thermotolerans TaxID=1070861 RepID=A0A3A4A614_9ACTN|nr:hypothetical protein [Bailinhaonella thermotolerans]RJL23299.1 hypothetical protein D5H75_33605 [Bailinhaonella thermotolerans]